MANSTVASPPPKKRRRWLRGLAWLFCLLIVLLVAVYFVATSSAFLTGVILPRVGKTINANITVSEFSVHPFHEVILRNLKVQTTGDEPLLSAAEVRARYNLMDIIRGNIHVDEVALASPKVVLIENADGTSNLDPFGRSTSGNGTPGFAVGLTAFTPEAVKEVQIVTAPFDVRYGNFAGGLINAVTKSGSNRVEGSILGNLDSSDLSGVDASGSRAAQFSRKELGLTLGAPIIRDRVALFVNADVNREVTPQTVPVPVPGDTTIGVLHYESLVRFRDLLRNYGVEPGSFQTGSYSTPSRI